MDETSGSVIVDTRHHVSKDKAMESSVTSSKSDPESTSTVMNKMSSNEFTSRSLYLSNRERLLLRKQALKMRKRPVLAVGNIVPHGFNTPPPFFFLCILPELFAVLTPALSFSTLLSEH